MQNCTFSISFCQEECISKGFEKIRSNSKFDPFERPKILLPKIFWVDEGFLQMKTYILDPNHKKKKKKKKHDQRFLSSRIRTNNRFYFCIEVVRMTKGKKPIQDQSSVLGADILNNCRNN